MTDVAQCVKTRRQPPPRRRSPVDRTHQQLQVSTDVERADKAIHLWITKHKTPPRQDIIVWLLERLVLVPLAGSQYRVAFTHELLKKSKLDIARAREIQHKQDVIAAARKQRLLRAASKARTHAKLDKQTKKLVHEATRDAIEYHKVLDTIERQTKTKHIQHLHEHELTTRFLRTGQRQKWHKGAWLGEGPLPSAAYVLPPPDTLPFVYDVHGRRHDAARAGDVTSQSLFDAVMTKIQREAAKAGKQLVAYFQRYDVDRSGTLTMGEFRRALVDLHVDASDEQMDVLFAWFDRNHTGGIEYGEVRRLIVPIYLSSLESLL
ncbi:hypothetical protein DYB36_008600 [Aphanomyces astaci]|uniref:EF-hand domain-containing protein n=1 Tax=Aphanomyces astaci TaxID=112090 RepID=A0A397AMT5_APHAT|nr:hypothetical protein DYB36_008600 [Aphanomyces astaci]